MVGVERFIFSFPILSSSQTYSSPFSYVSFHWIQLLSTFVSNRILNFLIDRWHLIGGILIWGSSVHFCVLSFKSSSDNNMEIEKTSIEDTLYKVSGMLSNCQWKIIGFERFIFSFWAPFKSTPLQFPPLLSLFTGFACNKSEISTPQ